MTRLITTNALTAIPSHVLFRVSKFVLYGVANRSIERSGEEKEREKERSRRTGTRDGKEKGKGKGKKKEEKRVVREGDGRAEEQKRAIRTIWLGFDVASVNAAGLPRTPRRTH